MKKKQIIVTILITIFALMLIPIPTRYKDGGTVEYNAILYNITKIHRLNENSKTGYEDGWKIKILGILIYDKINIP